MEPRNYKGTRDWMSEEASLRSQVVTTLREVFELFGFEPLETPAVELRETLLGKGGEETNRLIYLFQKGRDKIGLRFDHTVPLARVIAQHDRELIFPYRRYAIGPVWRADKPQKGRYRQFTQCDFDTAGTDNPLADAEVIALTYTALRRLGFTDQFVTHIFDRRALNGMTRTLGAKTKEQALAVLRAWDKLTKASRAKIEEEVGEVGVDKEAFNRYTDTLTHLTESSSLSNRAVLAEVRRVFPEDQGLDEGIRVLEGILDNLERFGVPDSHIHINPTLARGLEYYTGPIFETVVEQAGIGSITGGGRFDNLIEDLGGPSIPATGSSFGLERVIKVMQTLGIAKSEKTPIQIFVATFDPRNSELVANAVKIASQLRGAGLNTELYLGTDSIGKQLQVANRRGIPLAVLAGPEETEGNVVTIKDLRINIGVTGGKDKGANQRQVPQERLVAELKEQLAAP